MAAVPVLNLGHPLLNGAMLWWLARPPRFGGSRVVDVLSQAPGTITGHVNWLGAQGRPGGQGALGFTGTQYILGNTPEVAAITLAAWVKVTNDAVTQDVLSNTGDTAAIRIAPGGSHTVAFFYYQAGFHEAYDTAALGTGWHHLVATYDGITANLYIDGLLGSNPTTSAGPLHMNGNNNLLVGVHSGLTLFPLTGFVDDIVKWRRALSATEVTQWYALSRAGYPGFFGGVRPICAMPGPPIGTTKTLRQSVKRGAWY